MIRQSRKGRAYFIPMLVSYILAITFSTLDLILTYYLLYYRGFYEVNPVVTYFVNSGVDLFTALLIGKILVMVILTATVIVGIMAGEYRIYWFFAISIVAGIMLLVVINSLRYII